LGERQRSEVKGFDELREIVCVREGQMIKNTSSMVPKEWSLGIAVAPNLLEVH
jgi:hypothetical protein